MKADCDVFVAGAGPAGSLAALLLARRGFRVVLADRAAFPREKVCGGCLSGLALHALAASGLGDLVDRLGAPRLTRAEVSAGGRTARLSLPAGRALSRTALDAALVREAESAGARFLPGVTARLGATTRDGARIHLDGRELVARIAVAADGLAGSFLADRPDLAPVVSPSARIGAGAVVETDAAWAAGAVHLVVAKTGYVGLVRLEDGRLDVAACLDSDAVRRAGGPGPAIAGILAAEGRGDLPELEGVRFRGTPPLTRRRSDVAADRLFVIGDATGYVEPFTGEGMGWAMAGARAAAPIVAEAVHRWRPEHASRWRRRHAAEIGRRQATCRAVAALLRRPFLTRAAVRVLASAPGLAHPLLARLSAPAREIAA